ncbi:hypothetical protein [Streptomyces sp. NPDC001070]
MAVIALGGGFGAPGVTTTAMALLLTWPLESGHRLVLPGLYDPAHASSMSPVWKPLSAAMFAGIEAHAHDVLVDREPVHGAAGGARDCQLSARCRDRMGAVGLRWLRGRLFDGRHPLQGPAVDRAAAVAWRREHRPACRA